MSYELKLTLTEQVPGGKNRIMHTKTGHRYPDKRFVKWRHDAAKQIQMQLKMFPDLVRMGLPMRDRLRMIVNYRPITNHRRDITGMADAIQHLLEYCEVIEDDHQIKSIIWEWPWRDEGPCVRMTLESL